MTRISYLKLFSLAFVANLAVLFIQKVPGYMDAAYYYASGIEIFKGNGFVENFLWNFLDNPSGIPHPSHLYWMPLPSLTAALGMTLAGNEAFVSSRMIFLIISAGISPLTAWMCNKLTGSVFLASMAGLLAVFPGYYAIYLSLPESFPFYMIFASLFILLLCSQIQSYWKSAGLGLLAGLLHLSRADGIIWLGTGILGIVIQSKNANLRGLIKRIVPSLAIFSACYFLVMGFWFERNIRLYSSLFPPGNGYALWLTDYDQTFTYPADQLGFSTWINAPWTKHIIDRLDALTANLKTAVAVQGQVSLFPLILIGGWQLRKDRRVQLTAGIWLLTLGVMSAAFPYAGSRGGFFHSGAAFQPMFWSLAPIGLKTLVGWVARFRPWNVEKATVNFGLMLVFISAIMTGALVYLRVIGENPQEPVWEASWRNYTQEGQVLKEIGAEANSIVMVNNPPEFWLATGYPSIVIPDGDVSVSLKAADRYGARYLLLEKNSVRGLQAIYLRPDQAPEGMRWISSRAAMHLFEIKSGP